MNTLFRLTRLELAILLAGITGLGLQILAGRLLTPTFGSSIYTWGSIIGVFMICLSIGYKLGGKLSKTKKHYFSLVLLTASFFILLLAYFGPQLTTLLGTLPLPATYAALPAVLLLFGPAVLLLGSLIPYAVELSTKKRKGEASASIFTIDTIGSIIGVFIVTFVFIPLFSTQIVFALLGLLLLGAFFLLSSDANQKTIGGLFCCLFLLVILLQSIPVPNITDEVNYTFLIEELFGICI
jgi:predicted membrane-bound spermidine synthase